MSRSKIPEVRTAHTGQETWRRHRRYGYDAPACDVDVIEYNYGQPIALVEDKHSNAKPEEGTWQNTATQNAKRSLANASGIPFFSRRYWQPSWMQLVIPLNEEADKLLHTDGELLTEWEYVVFLYELRGNNFPPEGDDQFKASKISDAVDDVAIDWCLKHHPNALILDEDFE